MEMKTILLASLLVVPLPYTVAPLIANKLRPMFGIQPQTTTTIKTGPTDGTDETKILKKIVL